MPDVDLRHKKTTSPQNDSWSLIDTRGAHALFSIKQPNAPRVTMLDPISLLGILQRIQIIRLPILNTHTFRNSLEG